MNELHNVNFIFLNTTQKETNTCGNMFKWIPREDEYLVNMQHTVIPSWYQREGYIKAMANLIQKELACFAFPEKVLHSFIKLLHSFIKLYHLPCDYLLFQIVLFKCIYSYIRCCKTHAGYPGLWWITFSCSNLYLEHAFDLKT